MMKLTEDDMKRLNPDGIQLLINDTKQQLKVWSLSRIDKKKLEEQLKELEGLLEIATKE